MKVWSRSPQRIADEAVLLRAAMRSEEQIVVAGDWHSDPIWLMNVFSRIRDWPAPITTIVQLGDLEIRDEKAGKDFLRRVDERCRGAGIKYVLVVPGNHDNLDALANRPEWRQRKLTQLSAFVWVVPYGEILDIGSRRVMFFGGAASVHKNLVAGKNWWPQEVPDEAVYKEAAAAGKVDVLFTHEAINGGPEAIQGIIDSSASRGIPADRRTASRRSRDLITHVYDAVDPEIAFHGHMHWYAEPARDATRRIFALSTNQRLGNLGSLSLTDLSFTRI
ncbi:metallophosphoesterase [Frondihabitans peucedani]|uniref:Calcineurin-like phosphoesterase domain-containing protein n=1 Tax=Frondihabitans peucedani TaxID=598626 RepID=A0ABP8E1G6_9MICO